MNIEAQKSGESQLIALMQEELTRRQASNPAYSLRAFSKRIGIVPSAASEIMSGKRRVSQAMAKIILENLQINPRKMNNLLSKLASRKKVDGAKELKTYTQVDMTKYHVISDWYYFAILSLAETKSFLDTPEWISERLNITLKQARLGLKHLEDLEMLFRNRDGKLRATGKKFKTTNDIQNLALQRSHLQTLDLAKSAVFDQGVEQRDIGSITMAIDTSLLPESKE
ncbi:MAG: TIGR02147 family protein, partial [Bdellovibrionales bacterium]|nr:TIGR02147 family protein [Bdellovibrionales bacterium]